MARNTKSESSSTRGKESHSRGGIRSARIARALRDELTSIICDVDIKAAVYPDENLLRSVSISEVEVSNDLMFAKAHVSVLGTSSSSSSSSSSFLPFFHLPSFFLSFFLSVFLSVCLSFFLSSSLSWNNCYILYLHQVGAAAKERLQALNPFAAVNIEERAFSALDDDFFRQFQAILCSSAALNEVYSPFSTFISYTVL